jgi:peptidoglycan/xylan/chitin deacetylase (PgdA/CDA1 family)
MKNYKSSEDLKTRLFDFEKEKTLNGAIMLIHLGTEDSRTDKLYHSLEEIIKSLKQKGYQFVKF